MVMMANNSRLPIAYIGKTNVVPRYGSKQVPLENVYHVLGTKKTLLLVAQLTFSSYYVFLEPCDFKVYHDLISSTPTMEGWSLESVYVMAPESSYIDKMWKNEIANLWHARLGHVNYHKLKVMMKKSMLKGLP